MVESTACLRYFEWDRSETIFGNFSENVVQVFMHYGETRQEEVKVKAQPPTQKIESSCPPPCSPTPSPWTPLTI